MPPKGDDDDRDLEEYEAANDASGRNRKDITEIEYPAPWISVSKRKPGTMKPMSEFEKKLVKVREQDFVRNPLVPSINSADHGFRKYVQYPKPPTKMERCGRSMCKAANFAHWIPNLEYGSLESRKVKLAQEMIALLMTFCCLLAANMFTLYLQPSFADSWRNDALRLVHESWLQSSDWRMRMVFNSILIVLTFTALAGFYITAYINLASMNIETEDEWKIFVDRLGFARRLPYFCLTVQFFAHPVPAVMLFITQIPFLSAFVVPILGIGYYTTNIMRISSVAGAMSVKSYRQALERALKDPELEKVAGADNNFTISGQDMGDYLRLFLEQKGADSIYAVSRSKWMTFLEEFIVVKYSKELKLSYNTVLLARKVFDKYFDAAVELEVQAGMPVKEKE